MPLLCDDADMLLLPYPSVVTVLTFGQNVIDCSGSPRLRLLVPVELCYESVLLVIDPRAKQFATNKMYGYADILMTISAFELQIRDAAIEIITQKTPLLHFEAILVDIIPIVTRKRLFDRISRTFRNSVSDIWMSVGIKRFKIAALSFSILLFKTQLPIGIVKANDGIAEHFSMTSVLHPDFLR